MAVCPIDVAVERARQVGMGIDVSRHHDLIGHIDYVVSEIRCDVLSDHRDFSVFDPQVELTIDVVGGIDHAAIL